MKRESLLLTTLIMITASSSVLLSLAFLKSIFLTFLIYHLGICIVLPFLDLIIFKKLSFKEIAEYLGVCNRRGLTIGFVHGLLILAITIGGFLFFGRYFLAENNITSAIKLFGIQERSIVLMVVFMIFLNGIVEEIFWRGYIHQRLVHVEKRWMAIGMTAFFYASYHAYTLLHFIRNNSISGLFVLCVFLAGFFWGWLREKFKSTWPAIIGHTLATTGYILVYLVFV
jgi:uncharacterized protein